MATLELTPPVLPVAISNKPQVTPVGYLMGWRFILEKKIVAMELSGYEIVITCENFTQ
jgi:hypothetical protein